MISDEFWSTSAQTMPVLALAIVVEARATIAKWTLETPRYIKRVQGLLWAIPLIIFTLSTAQCMYALSGQAVAEWWAVAVRAGMSLGLASLLLAPTVEVLAVSHARTFARVLNLFMFRRELVKLQKLKTRDWRAMRHAERNTSRATREEISLRAFRQGMMDSGLGEIPEAAPHFLELDKSINEMRRIADTSRSVTLDYDAQRAIHRKAIAEIHRRSLDRLERIISGHEEARPNEAAAARNNARN